MTVEDDFKKAFAEVTSQDYQPTTYILHPSELPAAGDPNMKFTITRRIYYGFWRRVWYFIIGRCPYYVEKFEGCEIRGISIESKGNQTIIHYDAFMPPQLRDTFHMKNDFPVQRCNRATARWREGVKLQGFWHRFAKVNARFLVPFFRELADSLEKLFPSDAEDGFVIFKDKGEIHMSGITVKDTSAPLTASVTFLDAEGHPTTASEKATWASSDEAVAGPVEVSEDGLSATVPIGAPGTAVIHVEADEAVAEGTITVQPGDAVIGEVNFTAPAE